MMAWYQIKPEVMLEMALMYALGAGLLISLALTIALLARSKHLLFWSIFVAIILSLVLHSGLTYVLNRMLPVAP